MDEEINETKNTQTNQQSGNVVDKMAQTAQKGKKMVDNVKKAKKAANAAKTLSMSGPLMYILFWVFVVIVAIIIITGIVMFLVTMPGMVMDKLKKIFKEIGNYIAAFYGADTTQQIDDVQIYETLDYIEDMGWDIKSEGFLTGYYKDGDNVEGDGKLSAEEIEAGYEIDENTGVVRAEGGKIILADSDFIFTYIMSDNYVYTLKNENLATQDSANNWFEELVAAVTTSWYKIRNYLFGPFFDAIGLTNGMVDKFGKGLIGLYYEDGFGNEGNAVNQGTFWNWDKIKIDTKKKTLYVKKSAFLDLWQKNNFAIEYSLDGWTGRYGMPLEFLLSVHKATMMPDLAYDMVTTFPTEVHLLLHDTDGDVTSGYKTNTGAYIKYDTIMNKIAGFENKLGWFGGLLQKLSAWIKSKEAEVQAAKECGVDVAIGEGDCTCTFREEGWTDNRGYKIEKKGGNWVYSEDTQEYDENGNVDPNGITHKKGDVYTGERFPAKIVDSACQKCKDIVGGIYKYLGPNQNHNYETYVPYISKVTDHWYRDVYFVLPNDNDVKFVDYDYDYESVMKERWTLYETYPDNSSDPIYGTTTDAEYKAEKVGEFIIYLIDEDGKYRKDGSNRYMIYDGTFDEARGNTLYIKNDKNEYVMYTGVLDENGEAKDKDGNLISLYRKVSDEEFVPYDKNETIAVAKKAVTLDPNDTEALKDVGWENSTGVWSAYKTQSTSTGFKPLFTKEEIAEESNETYKDVMKNSYINIDLASDVIQVGEGQRAETNPHIKKMFLNNKYFRYDGSEETAEIITALRTKQTDDKSDDIKYGYLNETDYAISEYLDLDEDGNSDDKNGDGIIDEKDKYSVKDYAGTVVLNQDSLNAFSMLENTHTLDSDYIYRDFKELIVELGYFEKEELTDETPRLLAFPVAIGSAGYPDRTIDKRENEFGTMVHSKHDIDANKKYTLKAILENAAKEEESSGAGAGSGGSENSKNNYTAIEDRFSKSVTLASSRVNNDRLQLNSNPINITEVGAVSGASKKPEQVPLQTFLRETEKMCKYMDKVGYNYCVSRRPIDCEEGNPCSTCTTDCISGWEDNLECVCECTVVHCHHTIHRRSDCGLQGTFEQSKMNPTTKYDTCCNYLVRWAFQNVGITDIDDHYAISSMYKWFIEELNGKEIPVGQPMKPGDILFYNSKEGKEFAHVDGVLEANGSSYILFNGGAPVKIGATKGQSGSSMPTYSGREIAHIVRLNWGNQNEGDYEGFIGNEAVVSPVSGILLDYGTYDENDIDSVSELEYRVNVDLRYGPSISIGKEDTTQQQQPQQQQSKNPTTEVEHESRIFSDKVGYARILVLNKEIFEMLDSSVSHQWRTNNNGQGLLSDTGVFSELVTTEEQLEDLTDTDTGDFVSETVYGYKEFTELYERYGIAGYVLYIDGFKCELPDTRVFDSNEDKDLSDESLTPDGDDLSIEDFEIYSGSIKNNNKKIQTLYEIPETPYKLSSEKATEKLNVEETIKGDAYGVITIDNPKTYEPLKELDKLIFIKEGTVIGRTFVNKELVEDRVDEWGDDPKYDYKYYAPDEDPNASAEDKKKNWDRLLGNYVRVIMRDENMEEIESVEDYMKLDEIKQGDQEYQFREGDLEILADAIQHEGGGCGGWAKEMGATTEEDKLYVSISTGYTIINKLNTDSGFTPDYNDSSNLWEPSESPLYNLLCRIPDREDLQALADQYGYTTGRHDGWYAIAPGLRRRIETDSLEYCDICLEAAEYIRDHDSKHHGNNGKFGSDFSTGDPMPHTLWQQGAGYDGKSRIWIYADKNKNGVKDTESSDSGDFYLFDTAN